MNSNVKASYLSGVGLISAALVLLCLADVWITRDPQFSQGLGGGVVAAMIYLASRTTGLILFCSGGLLILLQFVWSMSTRNR